MTKIRVRTGVVALVILALSAAGISAQVTTGSITGSVVDNTGGALPGATVTATAASTQASRTVAVNEAGLFTITGLSPGTYTVRVEMDGFRTLTVNLPTPVSGGEVRNLGRLTLEVGGLQENVVVTGAVTPVQTTDSSRVKTVTSDDFANIQIKGRDAYGLMAILPGVQDTNFNRDFAQRQSAQAISINGAPVTLKDIRFDGINAQDESGQSNSYVNPNVDAVGEVQVISSGYTAENGRAVGGMISFSTKSGTNIFRGTAWYNGRRDRFNSNDYFRKVNDQAKPLYEVNISGYSFGGPAVIPGLFDSRKTTKKLYFFVSQEFTRDARPTSTLRTNLPTARERAGDFAGTFTTAGTLQAITDPLTGQPFPGNVIPANRINPLGRAMLNLLPEPNGILNLQPGQAFTSNSAYDTSPEHSRTSHVLRLDQIVTDRTRASFRILHDIENLWAYNGFTPGTGHLNNRTPGWVISSTVTQVIRPTVVNEMIFGHSQNRFGWLAGPERSTDGSLDYRTRYAAALGINAPRLRPFGAYSDPPEIKKLGGPQADEWPYAPIYATTGGNRANLAGYDTGNGNVVPRMNFNGRFSFQDDLTVIKGRHTFKFGFFTEWARKTEPGSANYRGNYAFGHNANNPLNTGNGYANMLLGYFNTYTELTSRVDRAAQHWTTDFYAQDSWRVTPRFTLDFGMRFTHAGSQYEVRNMNSGFFPDLWDLGQAARVYKQVCTTGPGNLSCGGANQRTIDPANPGTLLPGAFAGNLVPGTGDVINGISTTGLPGEKPGTYVRFPYLKAAPRLGFAWDMTGDGRTALRASTGIFYQLPTTGNGFGYAYAGGCPVSCTKVIRWAHFDAVAAAASGAGTFVETPTDVAIGGLDVPLGHSYNANIAFQRDLGFKTVAEIAWVGNFVWSPGRNVDQNRLPYNLFANVSNLFNNAPMDDGYLRSVYGQYPGMGQLNEFIADLYSQTVKYNSLQLNIARRLSDGLQMGVAYTLAKGEGFQGYDPYTDEIGGEAAVRARYWGPTDVDRRHSLVVNYSYDIPALATGSAFLRHLVSNWQVSGVTKLQSGAAVTPSCSSNNSGVANSLPSLTNGVTASCQLTGEPVNLDLSQRDPDTPHFNLAAFAMAQPTDSNGDGIFDVGSFGSVGTIGMLRNPTWTVWDLTVARRFPISVAGRDAGIRLQIQVYNLFNQVQFTTLNAAFQYTGANNSVNNNANTGRYTATAAPMSGENLAPGLIPPRMVGATLRFDW
jgi:outer membrane receptor protein involved in Fe transport